MHKWLRNIRMDYELQSILIAARESSEKATMIRDFLLKVLQEDLEGKEKFNDEILEDAAELLEEVGPGALYWMADIAVQMTTLAQCVMRDLPTNVEAELGKDASAEEIVNLVVRI